MLQARIRIDAREYLLSAAHDAETIMRTITEQVRSGGGFVEIVRTPGRALSVLVSPGMNLSIELTHVEDHPAALEAEVHEPWSTQSWFDTFDVL